MSPACAGPQTEPPPSTESGQQDDPAPQLGSTSAAGTTRSSSSGGSSDDGSPSLVRFDLGTLPDTGTGGVTSGCAGVDFLFVIDNSSSMRREHNNLVANFPMFIEEIGSELVVDSYHVGVTTSAEFAGNHQGCRDLGALVVGQCGPYAEGGNFITEADYLHAEFTCAARVGHNGSPLERPMTAMENAINGSLAGPGQCNEGFLRDDALLVVVVITDEWDGSGDVEGPPPDDASAGTPSSWYQTVVDAKGGIPENVVAVVLTNYEHGPCAPSRFYADDPFGERFDDSHMYAYEPSPERFDGRNIVEFAQLFGANGFVGAVCEPDWGPVFAQAIDTVNRACELPTSPT